MSAETAEKKKEGGLNTKETFIITDPDHRCHMTKVNVIGMPVEGKLPVRELNGNSYLVEKWQITSEEDMDRKTGAARQKTVRQGQKPQV